MRLFKIAQSLTIGNEKILKYFNIAKKDMVWKAQEKEWSFDDSNENYQRKWHGYIRESPVYNYSLSLTLNGNPNKYNNAIALLYCNVKGLTSGSGSVLVVSVKFEAKDGVLPKQEINRFLTEAMNAPAVDFPGETKSDEQYKRLTRQKMPPKEAVVLEFYLSPREDSGYKVYYQKSYPELGTKDDIKYLISGTDVSYAHALGIFEKNVELAKYNKYEDETELNYIPEEANATNWDFNFNTWIKNIEKFRKTDISKNKGDDDEIDIYTMKKDRQTRLSQDFQGYYTGSIPEYAVGYLGTSAVEASQIQSVFGKSSEAINLVNRYDSSLLYNISFIFNFSKGGAYGVYLSALDKAIKTTALKKKLEQKGYEIKMTNNNLTAYPKGNVEKSSEEIQNDIDTIYKELESKGGTAIGINMSSILNSARMDASEMQSSDPNVIDWITILHLGGTIVHEAVHAKGHTDEAPSEQAEQNFVQWALPIINQQYLNSMKSQGKEDEFSPLIIGDKKRHASGRSWYKTAQLSYYMPKSFMDAPIGSDLSGRFPIGNQAADLQMSPWYMMAQQDQGIPIESRLGRQYMSKIPSDLNQEHDILEKQLRKYTREDQKLDPHASTTQLLSKGYDADRGYHTIEELLEEKRPKPLLIPLKKSASNITKVATLFGWMNNLSISDGSTIPGLGDRVMAWEDRDESFSEEEQWIRKQPRYNPTYDIKGFYYRWIEPRFQPQLFEDMTRDYSGTHPAKRFASSYSIETESTQILSILNAAKNKISQNEISSTRFIVTEDMVKVIDKLFAEDKFKINVFHFGETDKGDEIYSVWVSLPNISEDDIEKAEKYLQNKDVGENLSDLLDNLLGGSKVRGNAIDKIISTAKDICASYGFNNIYIVGAYPRDLYLKTPPYLAESIDFSGNSGDQVIKMGSMLSEKLGIKNVRFSPEDMSLSFVYRDILVSFSGNCKTTEIEGGLRDMGIEITPLNVEIYNKNFTVNMLAYNLLDNTIKDISELAKQDLDRKLIRTFFDPSYVCQKNPIVILQALRMKARYDFGIDPDLKQAMIDNAPLLLDGRYSDAKLIITRESIRREGISKAEELFKEFGLQGLFTIKRSK